MSWEITHRRWAVLREIAVAAEFSPDDELPWRSEYAELFGDRAGLLAALRYRSELSVQAQLDPDLPMSAYEERVRHLRTRDRGVRRILARHDGTERYRTESSLAIA